MSEEVVRIDASQQTLLSTKAWTAYAGSVLLSLLLLALTPLLWPLHEAVALAYAALIVAILAYRCLLLRSVRLSMDAHGVWLSSGILPWNRGVRGVKWRDLDEAVMVTGFQSWLLRSHTIRIGHRFTKSSEILLTQMSGALKAIEAINSQHRRLVQGQALD